MKYVFYLIVSTVIFIFQTTLCQYIAIAGIIPNIMLVFIVSIAFFKGETEGLFTGVLMGLLQDSFFSPVMGCNLFLYGITGYVAGCISGYFNKDNIIAPVILTFFSTLFYNIGFYALNIVLRGFTNPNIYLLYKIPPELVYNVIAAFIVYFAVYTIGSSYGSSKHRF